MTKCGKCGKPITGYFSVMLWVKGPNGNRRYPICDKCKPAVDADNLAAKKKDEAK